MIPLNYHKLVQTENESNTSKQIAKSIDEAARGKINHIAITHKNQLWLPTPETHSSSQQLVGAPYKGQTVKPVQTYYENREEPQPQF